MEVGRVAAATVAVREGAERAVEATVAARVAEGSVVAEREGAGAAVARRRR